ncbi:TonB-dependent receptor [Sphingobacterium alkalisoli]|uniref:TonB-dependent receptor n=1 Tax=Sphingobacterium alkalisoli TaxID=1874115 RepID=A0A4U0H595_9SPHI|nr:TonB-dependent receptor [Sphingobacterium alkalisoli]TJY65482.1 TonB-dependent receptor [Sphingobacterium alkalisoli]GGH20193.1 SusC/RagA family TonB-linked outer membrane protein [Sphingobacterium alkalisoli]
MKLSFFLSAFVFLQASATSFAQKINLQIKSASIDEVFFKLTQQTGHTFTADAELIRNLRPISLTVKDATIREVLDHCFAEQNVHISYDTAHKIVVISKANNRKRTVAPPPIAVRGRVLDSQGKPLAGALISIKGSDAKIVSDLHGDFLIEVPNTTSILLVTFIGYQPQELKIGNQTDITVQMKIVQQDIDQVVVVGYGIVDRKDLTGSVGQVKMDDLIKAPVASFDEALAGRVAGVQVSSGDGQPGSGVNIVIRGASSLTQDNSPLYVIDGFPIEDPTSAALNPQDILSIDILKDASATAIYGSRAANGVIIIETKKGKPGKTVIALNASTGLQRVTKTMDLMDPYEFVRMQIELDPEIAENRYLNDRTLDSYKNEHGYDWQDEMFKNASLQNYNLSLSGGHQQTNYMISGSFFDQGGALINSGLKRLQGRFNIDHQVSDRLKVGLNTNYSALKTHGRIVSEPGTSGSASSYLLYSIWGYRPIAGGDFDLLDSFLDPDVDEANDFRVNPLISTKNEFIEAHNKNLATNAYATYKITDELTFKASGGFTSRVIRDDSFFNSQTSRGTPLLPTNTRGVHGSINYTETNSWLSENTLRFNKQVKRHLFDILGGITLQGRTKNIHGFTATNVPNETLGISGLDEGTPFMNTSQISDNRLLSFLGRVNYNYKYKYYLTANFRADGSSKFFSGHRWGYFPSVAGAWRMGREDFMQHLDFISESKLRLSYGATGNNRIDDYAPFASLSFNPPADYGNHLPHYSFGNQTPQKGVIPLSILNPDLKWETSTQLDIGYDLGLFNDRITLAADVYRKDTHDLLLYANMPYFTGFPRVYMNIGKVRNQGLELTLNTVNIEKDNFKWSSNFNISFNRNKILALNGDETELFNTIPWEVAYTSAPLYQTKVGQPISQLFGYIWDGVYQYDDFNLVDDQYILKEDITRNGSTNVQPGDIKYRDLNGDLNMTDDDRTVIGNPIPKHTGGFSNNFHYKNFNVHAFFQWSYGNDIMNANRIIFEGNALNYMNLNQYANYTDRWTPQNPSNTLARLDGQGPRGVYSSRTVEDGSFIRLKTFSLGYELPANFLNKLNINSAQLSLSAQNLITWTNYSGMDPEVSVRYSALTQGFDYSAYPRARTYTFDVRFNF